ncbi:DHA2 family efflux MFS transporter permease subunit [Bacteroides sp.]
MNTSGHTNGGAYKWLILGNIMIGTFMAVLDTTIVNTGLPVIMGTLGASINTAEWVLTGYMLAIASILPAAAWLADRFGYKKIYFISMFVFTFGSFMCGNSTSIEELIFWRVIEGMGCGTIMPLGMAIVSNTFPPEERGMALGFWTIASAASVSFGPYIGGYLVDNLNWNYIFYVNVPVGIIALFVTAILQEEYKADKPAPFDIPGFITSGIFLPAFMYGLSEVNSATNTQGWNSPVVLVSMWISAVTFVLFIYFELTVKYPLINLKVFTDRNFTLSNVMMFIFGVGMFGSTFLIPLYLQNNLGYSALQAGAFFIPVGIIQGICSPVSGMLGQKINPKILIVAGLGLMAFSFYMNFYLSFLTEEWYLMTSLCLRGVGMGLLFTPLLTLSLANIRIDMMAQASSVTNIIRQMGGSFGVAIFSHILTQRTSFHTQRYAEALNHTGEIYRRTIENLSGFAQQAAGATEQTAKSLAEQMIIKRIDLEAYIGGINDDFFIAFIITLFCIIPVIWIHRVKSRPKMR